MQKLTERKREDILQAAKDEFRENGFQATSMDRIAEVAGVSKRTVYNHFDSKETLFAAVAQKLCNIFQHVSDYPYDPETSLKVQLQTIAERQMELLCSERFLRLFKMLTSETLASPELTRETLENWEKENMGLMAWIRAASADGKLNIADSVMAGKQFYALLEAFTAWPYLYGLEYAKDEEQRRTVIDSAVSMFLDHYEVRA